MAVQVLLGHLIRIRGRIFAQYRYLDKIGVSEGRFDDGAQVLVLLVNTHSQVTGRLLAHVLLLLGVVPGRVWTHMLPLSRRRGVFVRPRGCQELLLL